MTWAIKKQQNAEKIIEEEQFAWSVGLQQTNKSLFWP